MMCPLLPTCNCRRLFCTGAGWNSASRLSAGVCAWKHILRRCVRCSQEKALMGHLASKYVDTWRHLHPDISNVFTVWSEKTSARSINRGLRIDYALCSHDLLPQVTACEVLLDLPPVCTFLLPHLLHRQSARSAMVAERSGIFVSADELSASMVWSVRGATSACFHNVSLACLVQTDNLTGCVACRNGVTMRRCSWT